MGLTIVEKILAQHSNQHAVKPGYIIDVKIDVRLARDFGGANVVKNLNDNGLKVANSHKTWFTFDCNPTGSDQKYAANQQACRTFARNNQIPVFDINAGIGTHLAIDEGLATPGSTLVSTDSHANILGAIGAFGQGMGDMDIAAAWANGSVWFKVPPSVKIIIEGNRNNNVYAKDLVLFMLKNFGTNTFLGKSVELYGEVVDRLSVDERITVASMATEMGAIALLIPPSETIVRYCHARSGRKVLPLFADEDASYEQVVKLDISGLQPMLAMPGKPHDVVIVEEEKGRKIDSAFVGSCTNGRMEDMRVAARLLKGRKVAPGVVLKIVPSTDEVWKQCLKEGLIDVFKKAGALFGNAGCAGCAAGQVGQNGPGEVTVSTGNRNFTGKQGKGDVYLASPATAVASAIAGHITCEMDIPTSPSIFKSVIEKTQHSSMDVEKSRREPIISGRVWLIMEDNIDTDMIFHNQHLAITNLEEMGQYAFGNLKGWEDFAQQAQPGDIIITGKNFGAGSSRQQAVDCFKALGCQAIVAESFGAIYERNAINAAFPVLTYENISALELKEWDHITIDLIKGVVTNCENKKSVTINRFSEVQMNIYQKGGLLIGNSETN
ncbi:homoaconitate hydratase family protein [Prolixibacteraceae bacterium JC049]|nr:homoaconitate hydratase family protein [Prolixibacteraceae bacterium JC049]